MKAAYTAAGLNDKDFAEVKLEAMGISGSLQGYSLWLGVPVGLKAWGDPQKAFLSDLAQPPDGGVNLPWEQYDRNNGTWYYWNIDSLGASFPTTIYVEGWALGGAKVFWRLVEPGGSGASDGDVVERDTVEVNMEKIVWPSNETGSDWTGKPTLDWDGFTLKETWWIEKSLGQIINGTKGKIHTPFPRETQPGVWEGVQREDATMIIPGIDPESGDYHIRIVVSYEFDGAMPHSINNYVDASNAEIKPGFFANSGVYIDNKCEIQIYDTASWLVARASGRDVIIDGGQVTLNATVTGSTVSVSTTPVVPDNTYKEEEVSALITGIAYGVVNAQLADGTPVTFDSLADLQSAPTGSGSLTIDVQRTQNPNADPNVQGDDYLYTITVTCGETYVYPSLIGTGLGEGRDADNRIHLQTHWGSGVIFTAATVEIVE